jgi:quercetin dioxygenase-like cupin family protein
MHVVNPKNVTKKSLDTPLFTGSDVTIQQLIPDDGGEFDMSIVNFGKGVRNKFHTHENDQILIVTEGTGYVATEKEKCRVEVGDVVLFPAGEKHWHGATEDSAFSHIYIRLKSSKTTQLEK